MSMYWIYDLSNWLLCALIVASFVGLSLVGLFISRPIVGRLVGRSGRHNDIVSFFFAGIGVFYGLALGLIAVATWENYTEIDGVVSTEAAAVASFYRDLDGYPNPLRGQLETMMRDYTRTVIEKEWPAHRRGLALEDGDAILDRLENLLMSFEPTKEAREDLSCRGSPVLGHPAGTEAIAAPGRHHRPARRSVGGGPGWRSGQRRVDLSLLGRKLLASCGSGRAAGDLHRALGLPDRGDGQPVPGRIQRVFGIVSDDSG